MKTMFARFLSVAVVVGVVLAVPAARGTIIVPTGLNPGDKYHLVFVTSTNHDASATSIATYNAFVQAVADAAGLGTSIGVTWYVIGSTATISAKDNAVVGANTPVYLLDGTTKVADGYADMWDNSLDAPISRTETGAVISDPLDRVWTGTSSDGVPYDAEYLGGPTWIAWGDPTAYLNIAWSDAASASPAPGSWDETVPHRFYALSQELTVEVATPGTLIIGR